MSEDFDVEYHLSRIKAIIFKYARQFSYKSFTLEKWLSMKANYSTEFIFKSELIKYTNNNDFLFS